ncbi:MAG: lecithin retinol acyltransferase family protein [Pseudomonadales bacterium]
MARGDHIYVNRLNGIYNHHGIDCGDGSVIHFGAPNWQTRRSVCRVELDEFCRDDTLEVRDYTDFFLTLAQGSKKQDLISSATERVNRIIDGVRGLAVEDMAYNEDGIIARAESRLGETNFHLMINNCEHFASWCVTGISNSDQITSIWRASMSQSQFMRFRTDHFLTETFEYPWPWRQKPKDR